MMYACCWVATYGCSNVLIKALHLYACTVSFNCVGFLTLEKLKPFFNLLKTQVRKGIPVTRKSLINA